jgi:hypothetical protein
MQKITYPMGEYPPNLTWGALVNDTAWLNDKSCENWDEKVVLPNVG